jgi:hypothetical protein
MASPSSGFLAASLSSAAPAISSRLRSSVRSALNSHQSLKAVRGRGSEVQSHRSALVYLRELEAELCLVQNLLLDAWKECDYSRDFRKFIRHTDQAQQRLHQAIKKLARTV